MCEANPISFASGAASRIIAAVSAAGIAAILATLGLGVLGRHGLVVSPFQGGQVGIQADRAQPGPHVIGAGKDQDAAGVEQDRADSRSHAPTLCCRGEIPAVAGKPRNIAFTLPHWSRGWDMTENVPDINAVIEKNLTGVDERVARKILHDNAASLYRIDI